MYAPIWDVFVHTACDRMFLTESNVGWVVFACCLHVGGGCLRHVMLHSLAPTTLSALWVPVGRS